MENEDQPEVANNADDFSVSIFINGKELYVDLTDWDEPLSHLKEIGVVE